LKYLITIGMLEYWNNGVMGFGKNGNLEY